MSLTRRRFLGLFAAFTAAGTVLPKEAEAQSAQEIIENARRNADRFINERGIKIQDNPYAGEDVWAHQPQRKTLAYHGADAPGTVLVDQKSKRLYLINANKTVTQFIISVGREGAEIAENAFTVTRKAAWPSWTPTPDMHRKNPGVYEASYPGGEGNPMGAGALYLGNSLYRIHGTNEPSMLGQNVSAGCIRMHNKDIQFLMTQVPVGAQVKIYKNGLDLTQTVAVQKNTP